MDATRHRRTRDRARNRWYAYCRSFRFARHMRFCHASDVPGRKGAANCSQGDDAASHGGKRSL